MLVQVKPRYRLDPPTAPRSSSGSEPFPSFTDWLRQTSPELTWDWPHLRYVRRHLADVTLGACDRLAISWPPQHAKPVSVDALVLMADGSRKRLGDVKVGDTVVSMWGRTDLVLEVHEQGKLECLRIACRSGRQTVAAPDHPFWTPDGWKNAGDLRVGDVLAALSKPMTEYAADVPVESARMAGYFVGDGCCVSSNLNVTNADPAIRADVLACAARLGFAAAEKFPATRCPYVAFGGYVREWLTNAGLLGHKSHTKRVPPWVFSSKPDQIAAFVGAYFACDGTVLGRGKGRDGQARKDACVEFSSVNPDLLRDVQHLLLRLGIRSMLRPKNAWYKDQPRPAWRLTVTSQDDVAKFAAAVPVPGVKAERIREFGVTRRAFDHGWSPDEVVSVEPAGLVECRCLTVECDRSFTADDLVVSNTWSTTVRYPLWRMLREPGLRVGVGAYNQRYANKVSRWVRKLARRIGCEFTESKAVDEWQLGNGSTFIARGVGGGIAGEPLDLFVIDDPFKNRAEAESVVVQESVHEWYMDDVTPRIQKGGALVVIHARWNPGDLIGRIRRSEEASEWRYVTLPAIAGEGDPIGRKPGEALCPDRFPIEKLEQKRRVEGVGFESLYQQNETPRGGTFFEREWFERNVVSHVPDAPQVRRLRYWDLGGKKKRESTAWTSGVLMAFDGRYYYVEDVVRGRWAPAERNEIIRNTALRDRRLAGFRKTYFEQQPAVAGEETTENLVRTLAGLPVEGDKVTGDKLVRAEPLADAARVGLVKVVAGGWNAAYLSELEAVPNGPWMDQCDSSSGAFNKHANLPGGSPAATQYPEHPDHHRRPAEFPIDYAAAHGLFGMGGAP